MTDLTITHMDADSFRPTCGAPDVEWMTFDEDRVTCPRCKELQ